MAKSQTKSTRKEAEARLEPALIDDNNASEYIVDVEIDVEDMAPTQAFPTLKYQLTAPISVLEEEFLRGDRSALITFKKVAWNYIILESKPNKKTWRDDERRVRRICEKYGHRKLDQISTLELTGYYRELCDKGHTYEANRILETIHRIYEVAKNWDLYPPERKNPASGIRKQKERSRARFISKEELPILWNTFEMLKHDYVTAYFKLLVLTGLRRNTLRCLQWSDINFDKGYMSIREETDKMGKAQIVPLSPQASEILRGLKKRLPWVFWSRTINQYSEGYQSRLSYSNIGDYWEKIKILSGMYDIRIHDLRRTMGSYLGQSGVNQELIAAVLNHVPGSKATSVYTRFAGKDLRDAFDLQGQLVDEILRDRETLRIESGSELKR